MPFQHSEDLADQKRSLLLFTALGDADQLGYAKKHHDVIERFGRFPHRNAILGRAPRPDEIAAGDVFPGERPGRGSRFNSVYQAELARAFLDSHGLHAVVFDSGLNIADGGGSPRRAADGARRGAGRSAGPARRLRR